MWDTPDRLRLNEKRQFGRMSPIAFPPLASSWRQALCSAPRGKISALFNSLRLLRGGIDFKSATQEEELVTERGERRNFTNAELSQVGFGGKQIVLSPRVFRLGENPVTVAARPGMSFITVGQLLRAWCSLHETSTRFKFMGACFSRKAFLILIDGRLAQ